MRSEHRGAITLEVEVPPQPTETTCGPTCLHGVYGFFGDRSLGLDDVIRDVSELDDKGTLGVYLGLHALRRGYRAALTSLNLTVLDPSWFSDDDVDLIERLEAQAAVKRDPKLQRASVAYADFIRAGGQLSLDEVSGSMLRRHLDAGTPVLAGVSATYLYRCPRELPDCTYDDVAGTPQGHFVVVVGHRGDHALIADPWRGPPAPTGPHPGQYWVPVRRLVHAILLGVLTYDGNLLVLRPGGD